MAHLVKFHRYLVVAMAAPVLAFLLLDSTLAQTKPGKKYALLVGVRTYGHRKLPDLKYTENDVEELNTLLEKAGYKVEILTSTRGKKARNTLPTKANIENKLKELLKRANKDDVLLIALAGHGLQYTVRSAGKDRDESFFCPSDARPDDSTDFAVLEKTMLPFAKLFKMLDDSGAGSRLLLIDACRNDTGGSRSLNVEALPRPSSGTAALFSCKSGERAFESAKLGKGHGVFFYYALEALKGQAANEEGTVSWDDVTRYVRRRVMRQVPELVGGGARQTPHLLANVEGDPILLRPNKPAPPVKGPTPEKSPAAVKANPPLQLRRNHLGMKFARISPGKFKMGSPQTEKGHRKGEKQHEVEITKEFWMAIHEVTQRQFRRVMNYNPSYFSINPKGKEGVDYKHGKPGEGGAQVSGDLGAYPVENVSWEEAKEFCDKLTALPPERKNGRTYRLPTEAEWEYACRAGAASYQVFHVGNTISISQANFEGRNPYVGTAKEKSLGLTSEVGLQTAANAWGLYDMHGNVWEWCQDWYDEDFYNKSRGSNPVNLTKNVHHVFRGGSYASMARLCRSANRRRNGKEDFPQNFRWKDIGFRVVMELTGR